MSGVRETAGRSLRRAAAPAWAGLLLLAGTASLTCTRFGAARTGEAPPEAVEIRLTARQWVWRAIHEEGREEINELHLPAGHPVRLTLISEDVTHRFSLPALRVWADAAPRRETTVWFRTGGIAEHRFRCGEYCGARHAGMGGPAIVMDAAAYAQWASGEAPGETPIETGARLFAELSCDTCHRADGAGRGPALGGLIGRTVTLRDGSSLTADEAYLRESIRTPKAKLAAGWEPVMPEIGGGLSEQQISGLVEYLTTLEGSGNP